MLCPPCKFKKPKVPYDSKGYTSSKALTFRRPLGTHIPTLLADYQIALTAMLCPKKALAQGLGRQQRKQGKKDWKAQPLAKNSGRVVTKLA